MPLYINIELEGVGKISKRINKVTENVKNLRPAFEKVADDFRSTEDKVFRGQGAYGSRAKWKKLSPIYDEWKSRHYPGRPILYRDGDLKNSLASKGANHIEIIKKTSITLGSNDPKFIWHQKGTIKMPSRPPITFTKYQGNKWTNFVKEHIEGGF